MLTKPLYKRTISLGKVAWCGKNKAHEVKITIEIKALGENKTTIDLDGADQWEPVLSISGGIYHNGNMVCGGQIYDNLLEFFPNHSKIARLIQLWKRWHLNDLKAGTRSQNAFVLGYRAGQDSDKHEYDAICEALKKVDLYEDQGYTYGSCWLFEPIPSEVIEEIKSLADPLDKR